MINKITIKGERCSGTNYLFNLIQSNFNIESSFLGWKHGYLNTYSDDLINEDFLTIVITRNVYDWIQSFHENPHHIKRRYAFIDGKVKIHIEDFSKFIRSSVYAITDDGKELIRERHPFTLEFPKNPIELRNLKNENFLNFKKVIKNLHYIKYEDLKNDTENQLNIINDKFLHKKFKFKNWDNYKDQNYKFEEKKRFRMTEEDFNFILDNLNWDLENQLGWTKDDIKNIHQNKNILI